MIRNKNFMIIAFMEIKLYDLQRSYEMNAIEREWIDGRLRKCTNSFQSL